MGKKIVLSDSGGNGGNIHIQTPCNTWGAINRSRPFF